MTLATDEMTDGFNKLIYEYLLKQNYNKTASVFLAECNIGNIHINDYPPTLFRWYVNFIETADIRCGNLYVPESLNRIEGIMLRLENEKQRFLRMIPNKLSPKIPLKSGHYDQQHNPYDQPHNHYDQPASPVMERAPQYHQDYYRPKYPAVPESPQTQGYYPRSENIHDLYGADDNYQDISLPRKYDYSNLGYNFNEQHPYEKGHPPSGHDKGYPPSGSHEKGYPPSGGHYSNSPSNHVPSSHAPSTAPTTPIMTSHMPSHLQPLTSGQAPHGSNAAQGHLSPLSNSHLQPLSGSHPPSHLSSLSSNAQTHLPLSSNAQTHLPLSSNNILRLKDKTNLSLEQIYASCFCPESKMLICFSADSCVHFYSLIRKKEEYKYGLKQASVNKIVFSEHQGVIVHAYSENKHTFSIRKYHGHGHDDVKIINFENSIISYCASKSSFFVLTDNTVLSIYNLNGESTSTIKLSNAVIEIIYFDTSILLIEDKKIIEYDFDLHIEIRSLNKRSNSRVIAKDNLTFLISPDSVQAFDFKSPKSIFNLNTRITCRDITLLFGHAAMITENELYYMSEVHLVPKAISLLQYNIGDVTYILVLSAGGVLSWFSVL